MRANIHRAAALAAALAAAAGAARAQPLEEALAQAYATNPRLLAERAALRALDEDVAGAVSGWRPTVEVRASAGARQLTNEGGFPGGPAMVNRSDTIPLSARLEISQPLYPFGATVAATEAARERVLAGRAGLVDVEQGILADAATAYVTVVRDQSVVDLNVNNLEVLERQLQATRDRFHVGEVTRTDVSQAEARVADAMASLVAADGNLEVARAAYERLVGAPPETLGFPDMAMFAPPVSAEAAEALAMERNPAILRAQALERAAGHDRELAGKRLLPRVTLDAAARRDWEQSQFSAESESTEVFANVTVPLYQTGEEYARIRRLRQVEAQRARERDTARRAARAAVARRWEQLQTARARVNAFQASVEANAIALEGVEQEAEVGARTVLDVLDAEQEMFEARVNLVRAEADAAIATFQLLREAGGMTAGALGLPVAIYDPVAHYDAARGKWFGVGGE